MKIRLVSLLLIVIFLVACEQEGTTGVPAQNTDTIPPRVMLGGNQIDTAYLYVNYKEPGAEVLVYVNGEPRCSEIHAEVSGLVNTSLPGTFLLHYNASDAKGNQAATVTRTVHVVENSAAFLNGNYNVACTCTAVMVGSPNPTVSTSDYTATVTPGSENNRFELITLKIGSEYVVPYTSLSGNSINVGYFSPDYASSTASGTLSATKNTFTIETSFYPYTPVPSYTCRNVYTKQLLIKQQEVAGKDLAGK